MKTAIYLILSLTLFTPLLSSETLIILPPESEIPLIKIGSQIDESFTPCSTFKIPLALMGFHANILTDSQTPAWEYEDTYEDFLPQWKETQTPQSWIKFSCVWYSKILIEKLGIINLKNYLQAFDYGNQSFPNTYGSPPWIKGPLTITPREQVLFIQKLLTNSLPVSLNALEQTKSLLYQETLPNGSKLYGKTGWSGPSPLGEHAWFLGWVEMNGTNYPLVHLIQEQQIDLPQRLPRLKSHLKRLYF